MQTFIVSSLIFICICLVSLGVILLVLPVETEEERIKRILSWPKDIPFCRDDFEAACEIVFKEMEDEKGSALTISDFTRAFPNLLKH